MKIHRLIGILSLLLQKERVTVSYLAEKFEVSSRTIRRDIEALGRAGIPVVTLQGKNGGISIMEGYRVDRTLLTSQDMQAILAGLKSLDSVSGSNRYQQLMEKLSGGNPEVIVAGENVRIDLASWYRSTLAPKIELIQKALEEKECLSFLYYSSRGEGKREVEPGLLVFQWASWYLWGYCRKRKEFRLFKLNRMLSLQGTGETFVPRRVPEPRFSGSQPALGRFPVKVLLEPQMKWRLIEEFGVDSFQEQPDGRLLFTFSFEDKENLKSWLLSFGDQAELLEPLRMREEMTDLVSRMLKKYSLTLPQRKEIE
ncbi:MAG: YafY family transcriptional regulator [Lachnospiraceae bacterium]|nr:YafY family transcriptional regulator [Lachnospiraceae bacterium]